MGSRVAELEQEIECAWQKAEEHDQKAASARAATAQAMERGKVARSAAFWAGGRWER